jgi:hypothetical protein
VVFKKWYTTHLFLTGLSRGNPIPGIPLFENHRLGRTLVRSGFRLCKRHTIQFVYILQTIDFVAFVAFADFASFVAFVAFVAFAAFAVEFYARNDVFPRDATDK